MDFKVGVGKSDFAALRESGNYYIDKTELIYELVCSYMLEYENSQNRDQMKRAAIKQYQDKYSTYYVPLERREGLQDKIQEIMAYNIAYKDASHLACAIYAGCEYLLTTDIRFQKRYKGNEIEILNPLEFTNRVEEEEI